jgi:hypothetical protein
MRSTGVRPRASMVEMRINTQMENIKVLNSASSKPPQFDGKKGDKYDVEDEI